jgi:hypothetical protein
VSSPRWTIVMDEHVATISFIDRVWRPVYEGAYGRQYVIDGDGAKVYSVWFIPPGEPAPAIFKGEQGQNWWSNAVILFR